MQTAQYNTGEAKELCGMKCRYGAVHFWHWLVELFAWCVLGIFACAYAGVYWSPNSIIPVALVFGGGIMLTMALFEWAMLIGDSICGVGRSSRGTEKDNSGKLLSENRNIGFCDHYFIPDAYWGYNLGRRVVELFLWIGGAIITWGPGWTNVQGSSSKTWNLLIVIVFLLALNSLVSMLIVVSSYFCCKEKVVTVGERAQEAREF